MSVRGFLENYSLTVEGGKALSLPDWMEFLIQVGAYCSQHSDLYCCVVVPHAPLSSLLVTLGADLEIAHRGQNKALSVDELIYVKDHAGAWYRAVCKAIDEDFVHVQLDTGTGAVRSIPSKFAGPFIRRAATGSATPHTGWLKNKVTAVRSSREIQLLESNLLHVVADIKGSHTALEAAASVKFLQDGEGVERSLSDLLAIQSSGGVANRAFNVRINHEGETDPCLNVFSDMLPVNPVVGSSSICCLSASNGRLEEKASEFIQHFIEGSGSPLLELPFDPHFKSGHGVPGIEFCGVCYG